ncbi:ABC transporter ATP-binding protein [Haladaptatus sp. AB643]|uniref:ABC transporter ATP-binding protein n=1 Tax=Haladaptatus sp. AB643 TaxID=2934174 RepID=UPI00209C04E0|nr:ABC transporter ATP-binding protein [Haladaptatus sp. AB643]MCO8245394.1 ABC transporter ATP-binding protein [Haladaptatus sp. AB643]
MATDDPTGSDERSASDGMAVAEETTAADRRGVSDDAMLVIDSVTAGYGDTEVITDVSVDVIEGEVVTLLGPNGAGKTTLMNSIYGFADVDSGSISLRGSEVTDADPVDLLRGGVGYVMQNPSIFPKMTVDENLMMGGFILNDDDVVRERVEELYDDFDRLADRRNQQASTMSGGERRLLEIARALLLDPDLVLFDEPSIGLEPTYVDMVFDRIEALNDRGKTVLLVEQNAEKGLSASDRGYVVADGEVQYQGSSDEMLENEDIARLYLGA